MAKWGRKEYKKAWPSRIPVWTLLTIPATFLFFAAALTVHYLTGWTTAQELYLTDYFRSGTLGQLSATGSMKYTLLQGTIGKGQRLLTGNEIEVVNGPDNRPTYRLTEEGLRHGISQLHWATAKYNDAALHAQMGREVFQNESFADFLTGPVELTTGFFIVAFALAIPRDRARRWVWKHGRRLRGPELVATTEFNAQLGRSSLFSIKPPDGVAFLNTEATWKDKLFRKSLSRCVRIPRDREAMHFLIVGDSGTGKSATIRQILSQISDREEAAIVYDPAMEYLPQFYNAARGDVVLNPLDARCPFWSPGDEVPHEAEALTLAVSLFPDQGRENRFFVEAPRKIFAHLINLKPTPQELTYWMSNAEEIDKRLEGTELAAMIDRGASNQRSGVLGSLNMVADAFKLLPKERDTSQRWSTVAWAQERKGWVFITSKPTMRERMRPLVSLWLDLLVLRTMNDGAEHRKTWFVLDELASLQHLPQLKTAVTENRKSNNPMVLGFQGKAQVEAIYGHVAEAMLSQPATKIFLKTSEPNASEWISKAIGEVEVERFRESRTKGMFPGGRKSEQRDITRESLVMPSEVGGLDPLHGYLKHGNLVVQMRFPYMELPNHTEKFIERKTAQSEPLPNSEVTVQPSSRPSVQRKIEQKVSDPNVTARISEQHPYFE